MEDSYFSEYTKQVENGGFEKDLILIRRENIMRSLSRHPHDRMLEVGCGLEPLSMFVEDFSKLTIVEPLYAFAENAKKLTDNDKRVSVVSGKIEDVCDLVKHDEYDFIVMSSMLHETHNQAGVLQAVYRLCNKDTVVYIDVPNKNSFHRLIGVVMGVIKSLDDESEMDKLLNHSRRFDIESLRRLVAEHFFTIERQWTFFIKPFSHLQMEKMLKADIINYATIDGLCGIVEHFPDHGSSIAMEVKALI